MLDLDPVSPRRRGTGRPDADRRARRRPPPAGHRGRDRDGGVAAFSLNRRYCGAVNNTNSRAQIRYNRPSQAGGCTMDFSLSPEQQQIRDEVRKLCVQFDDAYWLEKDRSGEFPHELHAALAAAGWLGIAMPEEYGGAGLGVTEAAIMMQAIAESGAAMSGASAVHINIFGLQPVVVFGT